MSEEVAYLFEEEPGDITVMDAVKRIDLLNGIEELGMVEAAAAEVGLTMPMLSDAVARDPRLKTDIALAQSRYKAQTLRRLRHLAFQGSEKAIPGGKNKDEIIGIDIIPNDKALELVARMQFADELAMVTRQTDQSRGCGGCPGRGCRGLFEADPGRAEADGGTVQEGAEGH